MIVSFILFFQKDYKTKQDKSRVVQKQEKRFLLIAFLLCCLSFKKSPLHYFRGLFFIFYERIIA